MIWCNFRIFITCNGASFEFDFRYKLVTFQLYVTGLRISCYITFNSISCFPSCFVFTVFVLYSFKYIDSVKNECISLFLHYALVSKVLIINKVDINISNVLYFLFHCTLLSTHIAPHFKPKGEVLYLLF